MNPLTRKTIWEYKIGPDAEHNHLRCSYEKTILLSSGGEGPTRTEGLEIVSPGEDEKGQPVKKRIVISDLKALINDINIALDDIDRASPKFDPEDGLVQIRSKGESSGVYVILEVPKFTKAADMDRRWMFSDGREVRFVFESHDHLIELLKWLERGAQR